MNRDIKFHAFHKILKGGLFIVNNIDFDQLTVKLQRGELFVNADFSEVELVQYTGLKDKNGREVYEGDILYYNDDSDDDKGEVIWLGSETQFKVDWRHDSYKGNAFRKDAEIIGNIFENPSPLK